MGLKKELKSLRNEEVDLEVNVGKKKKKPQEGLQKCIHLLHSGFRVSLYYPVLAIWM